jgi:hypothetical protein
VSIGKSKININKYVAKLCSLCNNESSNNTMNGANKMGALLKGITLGMIMALISAASLPLAVLFTLLMVTLRYVQWKGF